MYTTLSCVQAMMLYVPLLFVYGTHSYLGNVESDVFECHEREQPK